MKKIFSVLAVAFIACNISCNNATTEKSSSTTTTTTDTVVKQSTAAPAAPSANSNPEGQVLMTNSDCGTCHNATNKIVGPSYKDIAAKYPNNAANISKLAAIVINGGSGVWGAVPMPAHASLQKADAEKMVAYILSENSK